MAQTRRGTAAETHTCLKLKAGQFLLLQTMTVSKQRQATPSVICIKEVNKDRKDNEDGGLKIFDL